MWIADGWKDYELLDCGGGEKLERWGQQILVRPDPQAIWETDHRHPGWRQANARYFASFQIDGPAEVSVKFGKPVRIERCAFFFVLKRRTFVLY